MLYPWSSVHISTLEPGELNSLNVRQENISVIQKGFSVYWEKKNAAYNFFKFVLVMISTAVKTLTQEIRKGQNHFYLSHHYLVSHASRADTPTKKPNSLGNILIATCS